MFIHHLIITVPCFPIPSPFTLPHSLLRKFTTSPIYPSAVVLMCNISQWWVVLVCMAALGMGLGIAFLLDVLLVVRVLGAHRMMVVFGLSQFFRCVAYTVLGPSGGVCVCVYLRVC